jgi:hypothetical protein
MTAPLDHLVYTGPGAAATGSTNYPGGVITPSYQWAWADVRDYNANITYGDNSTYFNNAILSLSQAGGGTLICPPGTWKITNAVQLKNNVTILAYQAHWQWLGGAGTPAVTSDPVNPLVGAAVYGLSVDVSATGSNGFLLYSPQRCRFADLYILAQTGGIGFSVYANCTAASGLPYGTHATRSTYRSIHSNGAGIGFYFQGPSATQRFTDNELANLTVTNLTSSSNAVGYYFANWCDDVHGDALSVGLATNYAYGFVFGVSDTVDSYVHDIQIDGAQVSHQAGVIGCVPAYFRYNAANVAIRGLHTDPHPWDAGLYQDGGAISFALECVAENPPTTFNKGPVVETFTATNGRKIAANSYTALEIQRTSDGQDVFNVGTTGRAIQGPNGAQISLYSGNYANQMVTLQGTDGQGIFQGQVSIAAGQPLVLYNDAARATSPAAFIGRFPGSPTFGETLYLGGAMDYNNYNLLRDTGGNLYVNSATNTNIYLRQGNSDRVTINPPGTAYGLVVSGTATDTRALVVKDASNAELFAVDTSSAHSIYVMNAAQMNFYNDASTTRVVQIGPLPGATNYGSIALGIPGFNVNSFTIAGDPTGNTLLQFMRGQTLLFRAAGGGPATVNRAYIQDDTSSYNLVIAASTADTHALSVADHSGAAIFNVDAPDKVIQVVNATNLVFYSDSYTTLTAQITGATGMIDTWGGLNVQGGKDLTMYGGGNLVIYNTGHFNTTGPIAMLDGQYLHFYKDEWVTQTAQIDANTGSIWASGTWTVNGGLMQFLYGAQAQWYSDGGSTLTAQVNGSDGTILTHGGLTVSSNSSAFGITNAAGTTFLSVNPAVPEVSIPNAATLSLYSDNYVTRTAQIRGSDGTALLRNLSIWDSAGTIDSWLGPVPGLAGWQGLALGTGSFDTNNFTLTGGAGGTVLKTPAGQYLAFKEGANVQRVAIGPSTGDTNLVVQGLATDNHAFVVTDSAGNHVLNITTAPTPPAIHLNMGVDLLFYSGGYTGSTMSIQAGTGLITTTGASGGFQAQTDSLSIFGLKRASGTVVLSVNPTSPELSIVNGTAINFFSDNYATLTAQIRSSDGVIQTWGGLQVNAGLSTFLTGVRLINGAPITLYAGNFTTQTITLDGATGNVTITGDFIYNRRFGAVANGGAIGNNAVVSATADLVNCWPSADVTGFGIASGIANNQAVTIMNSGTGSMTPGPVATSKIQGAAAIPAKTCRQYRYVGGAPDCWYPVV